MTVARAGRRGRGGPSSVFQAFAEGSSEVWANLGRKGKLAAGFTNSAAVNGDKLDTLTSFAILPAQHGMRTPTGWAASSATWPSHRRMSGPIWPAGRRRAHRGRLARGRQLQPQS